MTETGSPVPVAVVGAGSMGANHVRVYDELPGANLVEVVEPNPERAEEIRSQYDVEVLERPEDITRATAASVTVPNEFHRSVSLTLLDAEVDLLVEKPLATTVADASEIVDRAEETGAVLQVGHIERFNPAVQTLRKILDGKEVISLEAHRLGPFNQHLSHESVVYDLMIHDLDIIDSLVPGSISYLDAVGVTSRSEDIDHASTHFTFDNGVLGTVTASHVTHGKVRTLDVTTRESFIKLNYQEQNLEIQHRGTEETMTVWEQSGYRTETVTETPYIQTREPLKNELEHFLDCVQSRSEPEVSGIDGVDAVELAERTIDRIRVTSRTEK